jgi:hypothetical protein
MEGTTMENIFSGIKFMYSSAFNFIMGVYASVLASCHPSSATSSPASGLFVFLQSEEESVTPK